MSRSATRGVRRVARIGNALWAAALLATVGLGGPAVSRATPPAAPDPLAPLRARLARELPALVADPTSHSGPEARAMARAVAHDSVWFEPLADAPDGSVRYASRGAGHADLLDAEGIGVVIGDSLPAQMLRMRLLDAAQAVAPCGEAPLPGRASYFYGNDPEAWRRDVPRYERVRYSGAWPGIDLVVYGRGTDLEYDFVVEPGADPGRIRLGLEGGGRAELADDGALVVDVEGRAVRMQPPLVYQEGADGREPVHGRYVLHADAGGAEPRIAFEVGSYDAGRPLVIDPILAFGTYLGGSDHDIAHDVAVDSDGFVYVVGRTASLDFPLVAPLPPTPGPTYSAFITKFDPSGSEIVYSTYLGGSSAIYGFEQMAVAVDPDGNVYVTGETSDPSFPVVNARWPTLAGQRDAFVVKIDPSGSQIVYSTYLGGSNIDLGRGIAAEAEGIVYVFGITLSPDFPVWKAPQPILKGTSDAFLTKFSADGGFVYISTYLGGSGFEYGYDLVGTTNKNSALYVTGFTDSTDFPTTPGAAFPVAPPGANAFVARIRGEDAAIVWSTYLGGSDGEEGLGIALDRQKRPHVAGWTLSTDFPLQDPVQTTNAGSYDAYVARFAADTGALEFSTYLGGSDTDFAYAVGVGDDGAIDVAGITSSADFPTVVPILPALQGSDDAFVTRIDPYAGTLRHSTFLGGGGIESILGMSLGLAVDPAANAFVGLMTTSANFPNRGAIQPTQAGGLDAAVAKIGSRPEVIVRGHDVGGQVHVDLVLSNGSESPVSMNLWVHASPGPETADLGLISIPLVLPARLQPVKLAFSLPAAFPPATTRLGARMTDSVTGAPLSESVCPSLPCH